MVEGTDDPELDEEGLKMSLKVLLVFGARGGRWSGPGATSLPPQSSAGQSTWPATCG